MEKKTRSGHNGIDLPAPAGTRVNAVADGKVTKVGYEPNNYGKYTIIEHKTGAHTLYGHQQDIYVNEGQEVKAGQHIGNVGSSGVSTGPHLHFGLDGNGDSVFSKEDSVDNPESVLFGGF